jgi:hypothetical protein
MAHPTTDQPNREPLSIRLKRWMMEPLPRWIGFGCVLIAAWGTFSLAQSAVLRNDVQDRILGRIERDSLAFCRDRNDTLRANRGQEVDRIRIDSEHFLAAGVDSEVVRSWETDKLSTIPALTEVISDCDKDGENADRGDFPRGAD